MLTTNETTTCTTGYVTTSPTYWVNGVYPQRDKGREAFEIIKKLKDKKLLKLASVDEFIDAMDIVMKAL